MKSQHYQIGLLGLTAIGVGTMIGSGWLFSAYYAAKIAGPGAFFAWLLTAGVILVLGLSLAEIAFTFPKRGLTARLLVISHNKDFAFICTIATWLGLTAVISTEAVGSIQYLSSLSPTMSHYLFDASVHKLTQVGLLCTIMMVVIYGVINFWGARILSQSNIVLTVIKITIPTTTAIAIIYTSFHAQNFSQMSSNMTPHGFSSVMIAMLGAGMIYSFNGFQNIVSFASETKKPHLNIPLAMILSVVITLTVYVFLQTAFIGALSPKSLAAGWQGLNFTSPFVQITAMLNLHLITMVLYADAVISPSGTGLIYAGSTTRMLTGMSEDRQMPALFQKLSKYNFSRRSLVATISLAIVFLLLFRSWDSLVSFLSLFYVISYMSIPICLGKLKAQKIHGTFSLPGVKLIMPLVFCFLSILFVSSKFPYTGYVAGFIVFAYFIYFVTRVKHSESVFQLFLKSCPILLHIVAITLLSSIGPNTYGGNGYLSNAWFFGLLVVVSFVTYFIAVYAYHFDDKNLSAQAAS